MNFHAAKELRTYIVHIVPKKLAAICIGVEDQNGFEACRLTDREEDPVLENADLQATLYVNKLCNVRCKDAAETQRLVSMLQSKRQKLKSKTLKEMPDRTLTQVL